MPGVPHVASRVRTGGNYTTLPFPVDTAPGQLFVVGLKGRECSITDPRATTVHALNDGATVAWGVVADPATPLAVSMIGWGVLEYSAAVVSVYKARPTHIVAVDGAAQNPINTPPVSGVRGAVSICLANQGVVAGFIDQDALGNWQADGATASYKEDVLVQSWKGSTGTSPPSSNLVWGSAQGMMAVTLGVVPMSDHAAPLRVYPRDDRHGPGTGRAFPQPTTWQSRNRFGSNGIR